MKKVVVTAVIVAAVALLGTGAYAAWQGCGPGAQVDVNAFRTFQQATSSMRDEMMVKRLELRNEFAKENPDQVRITTLKADMTALRTQIQAKAETLGLPAYGKGPGMGRGFGPRMMGCGGPGTGGGAGCPQGNCPQQ
jgi:hypothetical protein